MTSATNGNGIAAKVSDTINGAASTLKEATVTTHPLLISNAPHQTTSSFPVHSPATGKLLHHFSSASIADTDLAINAAQAAYPAWRALPPPKKRDIFLKAAEIMASRKDELVKMCADETGAAPAWAEFNLSLTVDILKDVAGRIASIVGTIPRTGQEGVSALVYKEPYGVILAIAPWNAPFSRYFSSHSAEQIQTSTPICSSLDFKLHFLSFSIKQH
jgi:acyl-CoA reductase-like NAD-dependent aldehyde dehydrogenase